MGDGENVSQVFSKNICKNSMSHLTLSVRVSLHLKEKNSKRKQNGAQQRTSTIIVGFTLNFVYC